MYCPVTGKQCWCTDGSIKHKGCIGLAQTTVENLERVTLDSTRRKKKANEIQRRLASQKKHGL